MVCFKNGEPSKKDYRHFNIKTVEGVNDFASMKETVYRRYRRLLDENQPFPQLVIIDGGKGQLGAAFEAFYELKAIGKSTLVGLAKNEEELFFHHRPEIKRVIFIASPLRGSNLAGGLIGKIAAILIRAPTVATEGNREMLRLTSIKETELKPKRRANSVDTLSPNSRFVKVVNTIPITPGVSYDTIIGDRGRGDSPNSSDGVVPYWSSHMDGAQKEYIVPSGHGAHQDSQAIADVLRILKAQNSLTNR